MRAFSESTLQTAISKQDVLIGYLRYLVDKSAGHASSTPVRSALAIAEDVAERMRNVKALETMSEEI